MTKHLFVGSYTQTGIQGVLKEGGSARKHALEQFSESLGAKLEAFYFAFGEDDFVAIVDGGDDVLAAASSMMIGASGAARVKVTVLLTPEEIDEAAKKSGTYRPPGQ